MSKRRKRKKSRLISTTTGLVGSGVLTVGGASIVGEMPSTGATAGVGAGFTRMGKMHGLMATAGAMGIITEQLSRIKHKVKKKRRRK